MNNPVKIFDSNKSTVTLTPAAIAHVKKEIQKHQALGLRLGLKKAGCSGLKYVVDYVFEKKNSDCVFQIESDLSVFIEEADLPALQGLELDFVREGLNGSLKFNNPNEKGSCGCGESFSV